MFGAIAERYDYANRVLSAGIDKRWRSRLLSLAPEWSGSASDSPRVLDLCTGTGDLLALLKERYGSSVMGADFCLPMLQNNRAGNFALTQADALQLPFRENTFDLVTVAFGVRNFENLEHGLKEIRRTLKPGGMLLVLEFGQPTNSVLRFLYNWYSAFILPRLGKLITGNREAYLYLPRTAAKFPFGEAFAWIGETCGLSSVAFAPLSGGIAYAYSFRK